MQARNVVFLADDVLHSLSLRSGKRPLTVTSCVPGETVGSNRSWLLKGAQSTSGRKSCHGRRFQCFLSNRRRRLDDARCKAGHVQDEAHLRAGENPDHALWVFFLERPLRFSYTLLQCGAEQLAYTQVNACPARPGGDRERECLSDWGPVFLVGGCCFLRIASCRVRCAVLHRFAVRKEAVKAP